jgi:hypothetical protein
MAVFSSRLLTGAKLVVLVAALSASSSTVADPSALLTDAIQPTLPDGIDGGGAMAGGWDRAMPPAVGGPELAPSAPGDAGTTPSVAAQAAPVTVAMGALEIPTRVLQAYIRAASATARQNPSCHLSWALLAGIGRIESGHARGGAVSADGRTLSPILGPVLSGGAGVASIRDSDSGRYDGDATWDRAVGPMQFIPTSWTLFGRDGNRDGVADPHNVDDAALAAAGYLCGRDRDLSDTADRRQAVFGYNHSWDYVDTVLAWMQAYLSGGVTPSAGTTGGGAGAVLAAPGPTGTGRPAPPGTRSPSAVALPAPTTPGVGTPGVGIPAPVAGAPVDDATGVPGATAPAPGVGSGDPGSPAGGVAPAPGGDPGAPAAGSPTTSGPPASQPPDTEPPGTQPPGTQPPGTQPPGTQPPGSDPPVPGPDPLPSPTQCPSPTLPTPTPTDGSVGPGTPSPPVVVPPSPTGPEPPPEGTPTPLPPDPCAPPPVPSPTTTGP